MSEEQEKSNEEISQGEEPPTEAPEIPELDEFIFKPDEFTGNVVPRKLKPADVAAYLVEKIEKGAKLKTYIQAEKVAVFYDSNELVEKLKGFLDKSEAETKDNLKSTVLARIIARLGDNEDKAFAKSYYEHLLTKIDSQAEFEEVILLHEALDLGANSASIRAKVKTKTEALKAKQETDYQARLEYLEFVENVSRKLDRAEKVQSIKDEIVGIADRNERIEQEIKAYIAVGFGYQEFLQPWAARRIRQETWAKDVAEQSKRVDRQPFKKQVTTVFRDIIPKLDSFDNLTPKQIEGSKLRLLRAIKFFEGTLSEDEEGFVALFRGMQADTLANEGLLIDELEKK
ncbi:MAG: hypothetical protein HKN25_18105 [Pyrinomonadaceae bacterium]|nr:hypothetical protein [Pyrinomonadaceae bacterium]